MFGFGESHDEKFDFGEDWFEETLDDMPFYSTWTEGKYWASFSFCFVSIFCLGSKFGSCS